MSVSNHRVIYNLPNGFKQPYLVSSSCIISYYVDEKYAAKRLHQLETKIRLPMVQVVQITQCVDEGLINNRPVPTLRSQLQND